MERVDEKLRKLAPVGREQADLAWLFYLAGEGQERQEAEELLDVLLFQAADKDFERRIHLDPPNPQVCGGEYQLGTVLYPPGNAHGSFGLREDEWIKHVLITGMTGTGKTNLVFHLLRELRRHDKPFLVFDWKRNYRDLLQLPEFKDLLVFTVGKEASPFRFNPLLPPPGTSPGEWLMKLVDVIKHSYFVGEGVEFLLREALDKMYEDCGFFGDAPTDAPSFLTVRNHVAGKHVQGRMMLWKASALRVLEALCFRHGLGPVVNAPAQWDYRRFLKAPVVLELDALSDSDKVFLTEALILWLYEFRKSEGKRETFKHALVIEEGHHVLSHHKEVHEGVETIMETSLRQIREFGESVIVVDQEPSKLSGSIKANTYTKVTFNLGNGKDVREMVVTLSLTAEESEYINLLGVGEAIVSMKGRVQVPLHVAFPRVVVRKGKLRDPDIAARRVDFQGNHVDSKSPHLFGPPGST